MAKLAAPAFYGITLCPNPDTSKKSEKDTKKIQKIVCLKAEQKMIL
jgi:hypothetical protein